jgi:REP element-mobilizing transposase RayT
MTRCVRQSYLCGYDSETNRDYSHRKKWIIAKIKHIANVFAIKICAYAIMSNHYHLVLFVNDTQALAWSDSEVFKRWQMLFPNDAKALSLYSTAEAELKIKLWRHRLMDISWFMRCLNEPIARYSNKEDEKKGRFWEGRFKSQALLDEGAILTAMAYVDLNPIRANTASSPEESNFTSIQERIHTFLKYSSKNTHSKIQPQALMPFLTKETSKDAHINYNIIDYFKLVDSTGRILRDDKKGVISEKLEPILFRLGLDPKFWVENVKYLQQRFSYAIGQYENLANFTHRHIKSKSIRAANRMYITN